jgi:hypothetical protein
MVAAATGRAHRDQAEGPARNASLTASLGLLLLVLFGAELVTLLRLNQLITWHVAIGALLIPPSLAKTASTGWRIVRYYSRNAAYAEAGPPPTLLRLLGPLVVVTTLALLGSGLALVALGPESSRSPVATVLGHGIDAVMVHKICFVLWGVCTGVHVLARLIPAVQLVARRRAASGGRRILAALAATVVAAAVTAVIVVPAANGWTSGQFFGDRHGEHAEQR